jgi:hypothetical protein
MSVTSSKTTFIKNYARMYAHTFIKNTIIENSLVKNTFMLSKFMLARFDHVMFLSCETSAVYSYYDVGI